MACSTADLVQLIQDVLRAPDLRQTPTSRGFLAPLVILQTLPQMHPVAASSIEKLLSPLCRRHAPPEAPQSPRSLTGRPSGGQSAACRPAHTHRTLEPPYLCAKEALHIARGQHAHKVQGIHVDAALQERMYHPHLRRHSTAETPRSVVVRALRQTRVLRATSPCHSWLRCGGDWTGR